MRALAVLLAAVFSAAAADEAPQWLKDAAAAQIPAQSSKTPAIVLLDEKTTTVEESGKAIEHRRKAVKVLNNEGRSEAVASESYIQGAGKIREMQAWLITADGKVQRYGKDKTIESSYDGTSIYQEYRRAMIGARQDAQTGSVFGFETVTEEKSIFTQFSWEFQDNLPTLVSRFRLVLPAGWEARAVGLRGGESKPAVEGNTYTWEMRNLPFQEFEPESPSIRGTVPRVAVSYVPAGGAQVAGRFLKDWNDVGAWMAELADPQAKANAAISAKAAELAGGASGEFEKIRAIGRYTQGVRYVSIQTGSAKGGGYTPHAAADVFAKSYGDCKDKAALTRAMLGSMGMTTYDVSIFSGDRTYVDPKWASPRQFNHAILAVKVTDAVKVPAVAEVEGLGRLLFFDPTDENTPVGHLPNHEQGSWALIGLDRGGKLVRMPVAPPADSSVDRELRFAVSADGSIKGKVAEKHAGFLAGNAKSTFDRLGKDGYTKSVEKWVSTSAQFATVAGVAAAFDPAAGIFSLGFDLESQRYARMMNPRLMLLRPTAVIRDIGPNVNEAKRTRPVILDAQRMTETIVVDLPEGFKVDEAPEPVRIEKPFGLLDAQCEVGEGKVTVKRTVELRHAEVEPAHYGALREFMMTVRGHQAAPVVLVKK